MDLGTYEYQPKDKDVIVSLSNITIIHFCETGSQFICLWLVLCCVIRPTTI